ncbi:MAG: R3H domain-containing nucleic acid-binding protein, partial [Phormidesmis sp.]
MIADEAAQQVMASSQEYEVKGLSAAERRQLHGLLGEHEQLETFSRGREPERHLVVKLLGDDDTAGDDADEE